MMLGVGRLVCGARRGVTDYAVIKFTDSLVIKETRRRSAASLFMFSVISLLFSPSLSSLCFPIWSDNNGLGFPFICAGCRMVL